MGAEVYYRVCIPMVSYETVELKAITETEALEKAERLYGLNQHNIKFFKCYLESEEV